MKNLYAVLGVERDATLEQIRSAYRQLARQVHPDRAGGNAAHFRQAREAYETLSDDRRRAAYETARAAWLAERNLIDCLGCGITLAKYRVEGVGTRCPVCKTTLTEWTPSGRIKIQGVRFLHDTAGLAEDLVVGSVEVTQVHVDELLTRAQQQLRGWLRKRLEKLRVPRR